MVLPPWWILNGVKPDGPEVDKGSYKTCSFSDAQQAEFGLDSEGKVTDQEKFDAAIAAVKEKKAAVAPKAAPLPAGATEMKVTAKRSAGFYAGSACSFLRGVDAKPADGEKEATEAKPAVDYLRISGLGEAINTAVGAATKVEAEGLGSIVKVQTCYPEMEGSGRGVAQILIDVCNLVRLGQVHATTGEARRDRTLTSTKPWKAKVTDRDGKTEEITMKPAVKDGEEIKDLYTMSFEESHRDMVFHGGFSIGQDHFFTCFGFPITIEVTEAALTTDVGLKWRVKSVSEGKGDNGPVGEIVPIEK